MSLLLIQLLVAAFCKGFTIMRHSHNYIIDSYYVIGVAAAQPLLCKFYIIIIDPNAYREAFLHIM